MSQTEDLQTIVKRLEEKFKGAEKRIARLERRELTPEEIADATRRIRIEQGLPVTSMDRVLTQRGVPAKFHIPALDPWKTPALQLVERLLAGEGLILVLGGDTGRGKSCAAAVALARRPGLWVNAPDLAKIPLDGDSAPDIDARMRATPLLVLDEVGLEHSPSGYAAGRICAAITHREGAGKPTVVTTNLSTDQFKEKYGDRIGSRLNGDGLGWQTVSGPDLRVDSTPFNERAER
jgi:hypothetical protein